MMHGAYNVKLQQVFVYLFVVSEKMQNNNADLLAESVGKTEEASTFSVTFKTRSHLHSVQIGSDVHLMGLTACCVLNY